MAVRAAAVADATMGTPVRQKSKVFPGAYSPDSVLLFDSPEPAEKVPPASHSVTIKNIMGNGNIAFPMESNRGGDESWAVVCDTGDRPGQLSIVFVDDKSDIDTVVRMIDNGKCSAMTPGITYIEKTSGGAFDVEVFMEYHSIQYVRECMTLRPSEVRWNTRINGETRRGVNSKDISHGSDFSQALAASIPIHPELPVSTFELMPLIEPPHEAAEFELPSKPPDKTVDFELPAKPPDDFPKPKPPKEPPDPGLTKPPIIEPAKPSVDSFVPKLPIETPLEPSSIAEPAETNSAIQTYVHHALTFPISTFQIKLQTELIDRPQRFRSRSADQAAA